MQRSSKRDRDGVLPEGFYSTTNLPTWVRVGGRWIPSGRPEMDCALVVDSSVEREGRPDAQGPCRRPGGGRLEGGRVENPGRDSDAHGFGFMTSEVSSEKPKALSVTRVADSLRRAPVPTGDVGSRPPAW